MKKRNVLTIALSLSMAGVIAVGATLAYFTDTASKTNVFTMGHVDIDLFDRLPEDYEATADTHAWTGEESKDGITYDDVMPGDDIGKEVGFHGTKDSRDAWVAIRVDTDVTDLPNGTSAVNEDTVAAQLSELIEDYVADYAGSLWEAVEDKTDDSVVTYYYRTVLPAGNTDDIYLFDRIQIPTDWTNEYADLKFNVKIQAVAVQADNVTEAQFKAMDWSEFKEYPVAETKVPGSEDTTEEIPGEGA